MPFQNSHGLARGGSPRRATTIKSVVSSAQLLCLLLPTVLAVCPPTTLNVGGADETYTNCDTPAIAYEISTVPAGVGVVLDGFVCRSIRVSPALSGNTIVIRNTVFTGTGVIFASAINGLDLELQNVTLAADIPTPTSLLDFQGATRNLDLKASSLSVDRGSSGKYPRNLFSFDFAPALDASTLHIDGFTFERPMDGSDVVGQFSFLSLRNQNTVTSGVNVTVENLRISVEKSDAINIFDTHKWKLLDWTMTLRSSSMELMQPAGNSTLSNAIFHINGGAVDNSTMVADDVRYVCRLVNSKSMDPQNIFGTVLYGSESTGLHARFKSFTMIAENAEREISIVYVTSTNAAFRQAARNITVEVIDADVTIRGEEGDCNAVYFYRADVLGARVVVERLRMTATVFDAAASVVAFGKGECHDADVAVSDANLHQIRTKSASPAGNGVLNFFWMETLHRVSMKESNVTFLCEGNGQGILNRMLFSPTSCTILSIMSVNSTATSLSLHASGVTANFTAMAGAVVSVNDTKVSDSFEIDFRDTTLAVEGFGAAALVSFFLFEVSSALTVNIANVHGSLHSILHTASMLYVGRYSSVGTASVTMTDSNVTVTEAFDYLVGPFIGPRLEALLMVSIVQSGSAMTLAAGSDMSNLELTVRNLTAALSGAQYAGLLDVHDQSTIRDSTVSVSSSDLMIQAKSATGASTGLDQTAVISVSKSSQLAGRTNVEECTVKVASQTSAAAVRTTGSSTIDGTFSLTKTSFTAEADHGSANVVMATAGTNFAVDVASSTLNLNGSTGASALRLDGAPTNPQRTLKVESTTLSVAGGTGGAAIEMLRDTWSGSLTLTNVSVDSEELAGSFALLGVTPGASVLTSPTFSVALRDVRLLNGLMTATKLSGAGGGSGAVGVQLSTSCVVRYPGPRLVRAEDYALVPGQFVSYSPLSIGEQVDQCVLMTPTQQQRTDQTPTVAATPTAANPARKQQTISPSASASLSVQPVIPRCTESTIRVAVVEPSHLPNTSNSGTVAATVKDTDADHTRSDSVTNGGMAIVVELTNASGVWFSEMGASSFGFRCEGASDSDRSLCHRLLSAKAKIPYVAEWSRVGVIEFEAVPLALDDDVTVVVGLPTAAFGCSSPPLGVRSVRVVVKADRSGVVETEAGMTTAIAASGAAMALAGGGGGAALDAQALAVFSLISCSSGGDRYAMKRASFLLSPASIGPEPEGRIVFNLVVLTVLVSAQGLLLGLVYAYKKYVRKSAVVSMAVIQGDLRFPSMFIVVAGLLQQGTAVLSMRLVFDGLWSAAAVAGMCLSMAYPWLLFVFVWQLTRPKFEVDVSRKLEFFRYEGVSERIPARLRSAVMRYLFPAGRWGPALMRKRFGGPVGKLLPLWTSFGALEVLQRTAVCLIAALPVSGRTGCMAQFGTLVAVFFAGACAIAMLQPYRSWFLNWAQVLSSLLLGVVLVLSAILADDPANGGARSAKVGVIVLLTVLSYVRLVYGFGVMGLERLVFRRNASKTYWNECRDDPRTSDLYERLTTETGNTQFKVIGKSLSSLSAELLAVSLDGTELAQSQNPALLTLLEKDPRGCYHQEL